MSKEWGNAYWGLFHTLSFKLKSDAKALELFNMFYTLCTILPCPICTDHAIKYLSKINKNNINTRDKLINLFFNFHNNVNNKLRKKQFTKEKYIELYSSNKLVDILNRFAFIYLKHKNTRKLDINILMRNTYLNTFSVFMRSNKSHFNLD